MFNLEFICGWVCLRVVLGENGVKKEVIKFANGLGLT